MEIQAMAQNAPCQSLVESTWEPRVLQRSGFDTGPQSMENMNSLKLVRKNTFLEAVDNHPQLRRTSSDRDVRYLANSSSSKISIELALSKASSESSNSTTTSDLVAAYGESSPSIGSFGHDIGQCRPCTYFMKSTCSQGMHCEYCHAMHDRFSKRRPGKNNRRREKARLMANDVYLHAVSGLSRNP